MRSAMVLGHSMLAMTMAALSVPAGAFHTIETMGRSEPPRKGLNRMLNRPTPLPGWVPLPHGKKLARPWIRRGRRHRRQFRTRQHRRRLKHLAQALAETSG